MAEIWSESELPRPPLLTVEVENAKFVEKLHHRMRNHLQIHNLENKNFAETAALLSRLIARRKNSFRRMIGFRILLKLNATIARLLRIDLPRDLEMFCDALPDMVLGKKAIASLPIRNRLDFILVRLLTVHHIHKRIQDCSLNAAEYFAELMRANNYLDLNIMLIAVLAKLRNLNVILGNKYIKLYYLLLEKRESFPLGKQKSLLSSAIEFPAQLEDFQLTELLDESNTENETTSISQTVVALKKEIPGISKRIIDVGIEIEREDTNILKSSKTFQIDQLKTIDDIKNFIETENTSRNRCLNKSITKRIPNNLWIGAQKVFVRKIQSGDQKKALNVFRKFLSSNS